MSDVGLSKSRVMEYLQCPKLLWVRVHKRELVQYDAATLRIFAMGHRAGEAARALHPEGVLIGGADDPGGSVRPDLRAALAQTRALLDSGDGDLTLFEATFEHDGVLVRTDLFFREDGAWRFTEVKGATSVKDHYVKDAAIQAWAVRESMNAAGDQDLDHVARDLAAQHWIVAKTMPENPHEYTLRREWANDADFVRAVLFIRAHGYQNLFEGSWYTQLDIDDHTYWTMGAPVEETILINRKKIAAADTFELGSEASHEAASRTSDSPLSVERVHFCHLDNTFVYAGDGDYAGLFVDEDITAEVERLLPEVPRWVAGARRVLAGEMPEVPIGPQCWKPNTCPLLDWCRACPEQDKDIAPYVIHVGYLPGDRGLVRDLQEDGYRYIHEVPRERLWRSEQVRVWEATVAGSAQLDPAIRDELAVIPYPRYYLDFETINYAVPRWAGTRAWQQVPFQFSCHVEHANGRIEHREFLDLTGEAPMRACAEALLEALDQRDILTDPDGTVISPGPILTYTTFETNIIVQLVLWFPDLKERLKVLIARAVDLKAIVKRYYYHPAMHGSWSLKEVLPTVVPELDYGDLDQVHEGTEAQLAYEEAIDPATSAERREEIRRALLAYCERDTLAMVELVRHCQDV